jgi:hypothetical protein
MRLIVLFFTLTFSKLRITVNVDPTVSTRDRKTAISFSDFLRPLSNLTRLEIDYTVLEARDRRVKGVLRGVKFCETEPTAEELEEGDSSIKGELLRDLQSPRVVEWDTGSVFPVTEPLTDQQLLQDGSTSWDAGSTHEGDAPDASMQGKIIASTIESCHIKMSDKYVHWSDGGPSGGLWGDAIRQLKMVLEQVQMPNLRHLHVSWDYDFVGETTGGLALQALASMISSREFNDFSMTCKTSSSALICTLVKREIIPHQS